MNKYTQAQIEEFIDYLNLAVKENYLDEDEAMKLITSKQWVAIEYMMETGDQVANE